MTPLEDTLRASIEQVRRERFGETEPSANGQPTNREEWLEARRQGIGSSDAAAILGVDPFQSALGVAMDKLGHEPIEPEQWRHRRGHALEEAMAQWYSEKTGAKVHDPGDFHIARHAEFGWMLATVDRFFERDDATGIIEMKAYVRDHWPTEPPLHVQVQVQHQLAVTGCLHAVVLADLGRADLVVFDVPRNDKFIERRLIPDLKAFWGMVQEGVLPEPDGKHSSRNALASLFRRSTSRTVALPPQLIEVDEKLVLAKERIKELEDAKRWCENRLKYHIGDNEAGVLPSGVKYTWKPDKNGVRTLLRKEK